MAAVPIVAETQAMRQVPVEGTPVEEQVALPIITAAVAAAPTTRVPTKAIRQDSKQDTDK